MGHQRNNIQVASATMLVRPWVVEGAGGLGAGKTSGAGTRGVSLNIVIGVGTRYSNTNGGESSDNRSKVHADVSAASPICSDFQTFCPDWLHFGHFLCFGGIAALQLSHRIFPIYF